MKASNKILENLRKYEEFADVEELIESSKWRHYSGQRLSAMDDGYEQKIQNKLLPLLNGYDIKMHERPFIDKPGRQVYYGTTPSGDEIVLTFYNHHDDKAENREGKHDMLVNVMFNGNKQDAGVINLDNVDGLDDAFGLITMTLEDLGFKLSDGEDKKEVKKSSTNHEDDPEYGDLVKFKHSLTEAELLDILSE